MRVRKLINFNARLEMTTGTVLGVQGSAYIVAFSHGGVEFRGLWLIEECESEG